MTYFIKHELELIEHSKDYRERKRQQKRNKEKLFRDAIYKFLYDNRPLQFTVTDVINNVDSLDDLSLQKVTCLLIDLMDENKIANRRISNDRVSLYYVPEYN